MTRPRRTLLSGIAVAACLSLAAGASLAAGTSTDTAPVTPVAAAPGGSDQTPAAAQTAATRPAVSTDPAKIAAGREVFNGTCAHCHGPDAMQSVRKIDLRLLQHRYGDNMDEVFHVTVTRGRLDKGMPNWSGVFTEEDFANILAFLHTVQSQE